MKKILIFIFLLTGYLANADNNQLLIEEAGKLYNEGTYDRAVEMYQKVLGSGFESAELYYNLANAHFKMNELAPAILYYEKAAKLNPSDEDIQFNLAIANSRIVDKIETVPELFYVRWWNSLIFTFSVDGWAVISLIAFVLLLVSALGFFLFDVIIIKKTAFWTGIVFLLLSVSSFALANQKYNSFRKDHEAIVFTPTVTVKSSPAENSIDLFVIHEGTKVHITDNVGDWTEIKIANGTIGWLKSTDLVRI